LQALRKIITDWTGNISEAAGIWQNQANAEVLKRSSAQKQFLFFIIGIALVITNAHFIVNSASSIGEIIGLTKQAICKHP